jgi:uncharacterized protein
VPFQDPPASASWQHEDPRVGLEEVRFTLQPSGDWRIVGSTTGVQDAGPRVVQYDVLVDAEWRTRSARIETGSGTGAGTTARQLESDGNGWWSIDGSDAPSLEACLDVDLESSAMTNTLPVRRLALDIGDRIDAPAAYIRLDATSIERLEQFYTRIEDVDGHQRYDYEAPAFDFKAHLLYDDAGLVLEYPGIATRTG